MTTTGRVAKQKWSWLVVPPPAAPQPQSAGSSFVSRAACVRRYLVPLRLHPHHRLHRQLNCLP